MAKFWDIMPPASKPKRTTKKAEKRAKKKNIKFFVAVLFFGFMIFIFFGLSKLPPIENYSTEPAGIELPTQPPSTKTTNQEDLKIKLLNGSGLNEEMNKTLKLVENGGFVIEKKENTLAAYQETIIYYKESQEKYAKTISGILFEYKPRLSKFSQDSSYDLIIVIGIR